MESSGSARGPGTPRCRGRSRGCRASHLPCVAQVAWSTGLSLPRPFPPAARTPAVGTGTLLSAPGSLLEDAAPRGGGAGRRGRSRAGITRGHTYFVLPDPNLKAERKETSGKELTPGLYTCLAAQKHSDEGSGCSGVSWRHRRNLRRFQARQAQDGPACHRRQPAGRSRGRRVLSGVGQSQGAQEGASSLGSGAIEAGG